VYKAWKTDFFTHYAFELSTACFHSVTLYAL